MLRRPIALVLAVLAGPTHARTCDLQFFGDTMISINTLSITGATAINPAFLANVAPLLAECRHNVVNLEGVITNVGIAAEPKAHLLRMVPESSAMLRAGGVDVVTLANNHSVDYGYLGIQDTLNALADDAVQSVGAGLSAAEAAAPLILGSDAGPVCLLAYSVTEPSAFWATRSGFGANGDARDSLNQAIRRCAEDNLYIIVTFHWGKEGSRDVTAYQRELARAAIDAGASLIIGHHPHILQPAEIHRGRLIFHSIGNFAFGSVSYADSSEGMAIRLRRGASGEASIEVIPLDTGFMRTRLKPMPDTANAAAAVARVMAPAADQCKKSTAPEGRWTCLIK